MHAHNKLSTAELANKYLQLPMENLYFSATTTKWNDFYYDISTSTDILDRLLQYQMDVRNICFLQGTNLFYSTFSYNIY